MGTLSLTDPVNGTTADASLIANNNAAIKAVVNGAIDSTNLAVIDLAYAEITADTTISTSTATDLVTFSAAAYQANRYYAQVCLPHFKLSTTSTSATFALMEGTTQVGSNIVIAQPVAARNQNVEFRLPFTPSAGNHTYKWQWNSGGATTATISATGLCQASFNIRKA